MKSITTEANSGPRSSWRKWPPPSIVVCAWPAAPGTRAWKVRSLPRAAAEGWWILFDHDWETWGAQIAPDARREYTVTRSLPTIFKP